VTLTDRERLSLRRVALPTLLGALTLHDVARACGVVSITREADLAQAACWLAERRGRRGRPRALRVYRTRAIRALLAAQALDDAISRAARWAARLAREMTAVREAERDYLAVQWNARCEMVTRRAAAFLRSTARLALQRGAGLTLARACEPRRGTMKRLTRLLDLAITLAALVVLSRGLEREDR
jgi:hypothetical protein